MNIRSISSTIQATDVQAKKEAKTEHSGNKEQKDQGYQSSEKEKSFTEDDLKESIEKLKKNPNFRDKNLNIRYEVKDTGFVVYIEDYTGKVLRRIPPNEVWAFLQVDEQFNKGHLLNKSL